MVKLPDTRQLQRNQPQYTGQVMNVPVAQDSQGLASIAGAVGRMANAGADYAAAQQRLDAKRLNAEQDILEKRQAEIDKFNILNAKSYFSNNAKRLTADLEQDPEYNETPEKFNNGFKNIKENTIASLPDDIKKDPLKMGYLNRFFEKTYTDYTLKIREAQYRQQNDTVSASLFETSNKYVQNYAMLNDNERQEATSNLSAMYQSAVGAGIITREQASKDIYEARTRAERSRLEVLPDEQVMQEYGGKDNEVTKYAKRLVLESGGRNLQNPNSSAGGYFQWTDATAKQYGVTKGDLESEIAGLKKFDADNAKEFKSVVGREPKQWETYLLHQQGGAGGSAIIANPDKNIVDVLSPFYKDKENLRDAIINNGGSVDMTAKEFSDIWRKKENNANISVIPDNVAQVLQSSFGGSQSVLPQGEVIKRLQIAEKTVIEKQEKQQIDDIINTVTLKYPDSYEAQVAIVGGLDIPFDQRKKVMTILDSNKTRQETIKRDNAEQLSYKAIEYINGGGLFENMPADMVIQLNASQRTYLQSYSDKANNKEGNKAKLKQSELLEYTKVTSLISDGDIDTLKKEYPPEKAVTLLNPKHYEQYLKAINPQQDAQNTPKATQQEENRRISAVFNNIGIANKRNNGQALQQGLFYDKYYDAREAFIADNGRQPKGSEIQDILDGLVRERVVNKGYFSDTTKMEFELTDKDTVLPSEEERIAIIIDLKKKFPNRETNFTDEEINGIFNMSIKR